MHKNYRALFCLVAAAALGFASTNRAPAQSTPVNLGPIDGTWEGELNRIHGPGLDTHDYPKQSWRITLQDNSAHMFISRDAKWQEVHPRKFAVTRLDTNVLITSIVSGHDSDGEWIETESWTLLQTGPDTLGVVSAGAINNANIPLTNDKSKIFDTQTGVFHRVQ